MDHKEKLIQIRKQSYFVRGDVAVFLAALLLIVCTLVVSLNVPKEIGTEFTVFYRGEAIYSADLTVDAEYVFYITGGGGKVELYDSNKEYEQYNRIQVKDGMVRVAEADCADHTCQHLGSRNWGELSCGPHYLRIEIRGEGLETDI